MTKAIKNGMVYDTEQSEKITGYSNGGTTRDFSHVRETLYKTDNGNYFIHGRGGPKTKYAVSQPNGTSGGHEIKPVTEDEALAWAERRDVEPGEVIAEFGEVLEDA
jgi:hypothetical protein